MLLGSPTTRTFIAIAGNIGSGKTTLTSMLSKHFGWEARYESVSDNPYLSDFYVDMKRWAFPLQIYFMTRRVRDHVQIVQNNTSAIQDRTIYEDAGVFARNLYEQGIMDEREYTTYRGLYDVLADSLPSPDLIVYLRKSVPKLKERIQLRGRDYEQSIPDEYLHFLNRYYDEWIQTYQGPKLVIESDKLDFVKHPDHFDLICQKIVKSLDQQDLFLMPQSDNSKDKKNIS